PMHCVKAFSAFSHATNLSQLGLQFGSLTQFSSGTQFSIPAMHFSQSSVGVMQVPAPPDPLLDDTLLDTTPLLEDDVPLDVAPPADEELSLELEELAVEELAIEELVVEELVAEELTVEELMLDEPPLEALDAIDELLAPPAPTWSTVPPQAAA